MAREPTQGEWDVLRCLSMGRGRYAPLAIRDDDAGRVYVVRRGGMRRPGEAWSIDLIEACRAAGWVAYLAAERRYQLTPAGRGLVERGGA